MQTNTMKLLDIFSKEDQILFACTRKEFQEIHRQMVIDICSRNNVCWDIILETALKHGVDAFVYRNLLKCVSKDCMIPQEILDKFKRYWRHEVALVTVWQWFTAVD